MIRLMTGAAAIALFASLAQAQDGPLAGETITYIIATEPGGGYDTYGRLIGKYLGKHLGADMIFRNLPGAGHIIGANTLFASEPDGTTIGTFNTGLIYSQITGAEGVQFDLNEMSWIGKAASDPRVLVTSTQSGFSDFEALRAAEGPHLFAAAGVGSASYNETQLLSRALGLSIEIVAGFNGNEGELAMMRGEVVGQIASESSIMPFVEQGNGQVVLSIGGEAQPQAIDVADGDLGQGIVNLISANAQIGRLTAAPPGVPEDMLAELRRAYDAALSDPELLAEAETLGIPIDPAGGAEVAELISSAINQSPETVDLIQTTLAEEVELTTVTSEVMSTADEGGEITIMVDGQEFVMEPSGSRTTVTIDGQPGDRAAVTAGMECTFDYDASGSEPATMDCTSG